MKRILLFIFILAFSQSVIAQNLDISLIEYIPETNYARIQISNNLNYDLHNVKYQINSLSPKKITSTLKAGAITTRILNMPQGIHTIKVISDEITETKQLSFQASIEEKQAEFSQEQREKRRSIQREKILEQELEKNAPTTEKKPYLKYILATIIVIILVIIAFLVLKKKRKKYHKKKNEHHQKKNETH